VKTKIESQAKPYPMVFPVSGGCHEIRAAQFGRNQATAERKKRTGYETDCVDFGADHDRLLCALAVCVSLAAFAIGLQGLIICAVGGRYKK
jgi:hypothetical protein